MNGKRLSLVGTPQDLDETMQREAYSLNSRISMKTKMNSLILVLALLALPYPICLPPKARPAMTGPFRPDWNHPIGAASGPPTSTARHAVQPQADGIWPRAIPLRDGRPSLMGGVFLSNPIGLDWTWGLELNGWGVGEAFQKVSRPASVTHGANRVSYVWGGGLTEWFINDQRGLEQGWTFQTRPAGSGDEPLRLELSVRGGLSPRVSSGGEAVAFLNDDGGVALTYGGLKAWDADGRKVTVRFETSGPAVVRVAVEEQNARYPITVDPIAQQAYLKASNTGVGDQFGQSVAVSGDTVVVGVALGSPATPPA